MWFFSPFTMPGGQKSKYQGWCLLGDSRGKFIPYTLFQLQVVSDNPWLSLPCNFKIPISASVVMWPSSLCVHMRPFFSPYKDTRHIGLQTHPFQSAVILITSANTLSFKNILLGLRLEDIFMGGHNPTQNRGDL